MGAKQSRVLHLSTLAPARSAIKIPVACVKAGRLRTASGTGAMRAVFEQHRDSVEHYLQAFAWAPGQTGVLYCMGGQRWGIDLFDHAASFERVFPRL